MVIRRSRHGENGNATRARSPSMRAGQDWVDGCSLRFPAQVKLFGGEQRKMGACLLRRVRHLLRLGPARGPHFHSVKIRGQSLTVFPPAA
ncbi:hypothetical protein [Cupriavidus necator]|uniref:hypothetical protein n=1 Tax=Cupriavidus necator TaxID=106590 RepID=UPI002783BC14|nr:hypothetical protein [Cupriavidus necator]MDQ0141234.1 hypothetical protein [Cupriavidus necator]